MKNVQKYMEAVQIYFLLLQGALVASEKGQKIMREYGKVLYGEGLYNDGAYAKQYDEQ